LRTRIASRCVVVISLVASMAHAEDPPSDSAAHHVPPDPPQHVMGDIASAR
jgi:hypothetical protein